MTWLGIGSARAADLGVSEVPTETIASRDRPSDLGGAGLRFPEPEGVRIGSFMFFPTLGTLVRYDDNIYGTATERKGDIISQLSPGLHIRSSLPRHEFDVTLAAKMVNYAHNDDLSYLDASAAARGSLHFDHAHTLSAAVLSALQHEDVTDPGRPLAAGRPVEFLHNRASVGVTRDAGQLYGTLSTTAESWDYHAAQTRDGTRIDQNLRDSELLKAQLTAGYRFSPGYEFRTRVGSTRIWNQGTPERSLTSMGYEALAGLGGELSPVFRWEVMGGWGVRDFDQQGLQSIKAHLVEGKLTWLATQRLTLHGLIGRSLAESVDSEGFGRIDQKVAARAEIELWHNLALTLQAEARQSDYQGIDRTDRTLLGTLGLDYHFSDNWLFTFTYDYQYRQSSLSDDEVTRNRFSIGAKLQF